LCEVARRLRAAARESDTVARLGGDEFAVLQVGGEQPAGAIRLAEAILAAITQPVRIDENEVRVGVSIGIALAPQDADIPRELIRCADVALYAAKRAGRGSWRLFTAAPHPAEPVAASPAAEVAIQA
jgi:diguanylate cyclase (GGDEF)-like protein